MKKFFLDKNPTCRGFGRIEFADEYGSIGSLQESSAGHANCIWFGPNDADPKVLIPGQGWTKLETPEDTLFTTRMHLTQAQVKLLLPYLQRFVETGHIY